MRPRPSVASAALTAVLALVALPGLVGSRTPTAWPSAEAAAFQAVLTPALGRTGSPIGPPDRAHRAASTLVATSVVHEAAEIEGPGAAASSSRDLVPAWASEPVRSVLVSEQRPRATLRGYASFYDRGTTAMRLPLGTRVRICGEAGCIERVVSDYGPSSRIRPLRIADLYRPDFFAICGCPAGAGTTWVTVSIL
jgi:hypothetical protein